MISESKFWANEISFYHKSPDRFVKGKTASPGPDLKEFESGDLKWDPGSIFLTSRQF